MSFGGGIGLLSLAVAAIFLSDRSWVRIVSGVVVGLYFLLVVVGWLGGDLETPYLIVPILLVTFALFVHGVVKGYGKY